MKRLALAWVALAALNALAACGDATGASVATDESTDGSPAADSRGPGPRDSVRFRVLFQDTGDLVERASTLDDQSVPQSAEAANRLFDLDETSPLRFADLGETGDHSGRLCLASGGDTYLAVDADAREVLLGDGDCSYVAADAVVVGSLVTGRWTRGADLMGAAEVGDVFPVDRMSKEGPTQVERPEMLNGRLLADTSALAIAVERYAQPSREYPSVPAADLVPALTQRFPVDLGPQTRVFAYVPGETAFALCLVDGRGDWVRWDGATGTMTDGTYTSTAGLDDCARPAAADGAPAD